MAPPHLPQDIIFEINQRLPFRSVLRSKLVSKQWKDLINDPKFYTLYKDNSCTAFFRGQDGLYCVFINDDDDDNKYRIHGRNINVNINIPPFKVHRVLIPFKGSPSAYGSKMLSLGSSHGIACFKKANGHFLLYNWFTGSLYTVANASVQQLSNGWFVCYGFGYDRYADDYKILVCYDWCRRTSSVQNEDNGLFWVYGFRNKDWNSFQGFRYEAYTWGDRGGASQAYSFNGVLHWSLLTRDNQREVIVTYDMHTNRFGEIKAPPTAAADLDGIVIPSLTTVTELNGQLCCVRKMRDSNDSQFGRTIVWGMKEYGIGDSWERFATIECDSQCTFRMVPTTLLYKYGDGGRLVLFVHKCSQALIWSNIDKIMVEVVSKEKWQKKKSIKNNKRGNKSSNSAIS